jgi:ribosomal protein L37AE/L43A
MTFGRGIASLVADGFQLRTSMNNMQRVLDAEAVTSKPIHLCPNCSSYAIAATWSERVNEQCVRSVLSCEVCGREFETSAYVPETLK